MRKRGGLRAVREVRRRGAGSNTGGATEDPADACDLVEHLRRMVSERHEHLLALLAALVEDRPA